MVHEFKDYQALNFFSNQMFTFKEFYPPLVKRMSIRLIDHDSVDDEVMGTHFIDIDQLNPMGNEDCYNGTINNLLNLSK